MTKSLNLTKTFMEQKQKDERALRSIRLLDKLRKHPVLGFAVFALILVVVKLMADAGAVNAGLVNAIGSTIIYCIVGLGFCLLLGYSALASLGTAGFIAIGCYSTYYCIAEWGLTIGVSLLMSVGLAIVIGIAVGYISLRIEGIYLAIVTLGVAQIIKEALSAIMDTIKINKYKLTFMNIDGLLIDPDAMFYILVAVLFILMLLTSNLMNSPTGRAMLAMKNSTSAAQAFGISLMKYRLMAFVLSTIYAAIAGMLFMLYVGYVSNSSSTLFSLSTSLNILGAVIIGGTKSIWGTLGGTFIIYGINSMFLQDIAFFRDNPTLITIVCGLLVVLVVMFFPGGLVQLVWTLILKIKGLFKKWRVRRYGLEE